MKILYLLNYFKNLFFLKKIIKSFNSLMQRFKRKKRFVYIRVIGEVLGIKCIVNAARTIRNWFMFVILFLCRKQLWTCDNYRPGHALISVHFHPPHVHLFLHHPRCEMKIKINFNCLSYILRRKYYDYMGHIFHYY